MILFFMLIVLLAIAWGVADYQLQSRIERQPPPQPQPRSAPAEPRKDDNTPPAEIAAEGIPPAAGNQSPIDAGRSDAPRDTGPAEPPRDPRQ